jgi:transcriptional regulator with GAF, ATPase, and Fis domain
MFGARLPEHIRIGSGAFSSNPVARYSSMKSEKFPWNSRENCRAHCKNRNSSGSATTKTVRVDLRVVAATNRDLESEVRQGRFREDLFYRLSVFPINVPPLRERKADLVPLATHFLNQICTELGRPEIKLTSLHLEQLQKHDWPGNIRELRNVIERAVILSRSGRFELRPAMTVGGRKALHSSAEPDSSREFFTYAEMREQERRSVLTALQQTGGRISGSNGAAEALGIKPSTLNYRIKILGLKE